MGRTLVIGDIHGGLKALKQVLERSGYSSGDTLIFLGDYVDGWSDTPFLIDYLIELQKFSPCIFIKGNHDAYLLDYLKNKISNPKWLLHGGSISVKNYQGIDQQTILLHIKFLESLNLFHRDESNRLFIHAGFTHMRGVDHEDNPENFYWDRTLWETAVCLDPTLKTNSVLYPKRLTLYHEIYIGHTLTLHINSSIPTVKANVCNMDTGAGFLGKLSILDIVSKEFWQSDSLSSLYPNEKGRNT
ncbi:metallophosphoesterase [Apibacter sp. HY039]|uniref:metallophosphoesterase n=1 Tax=Apibacter sp. HY039 TaxID=2501476 RepID=UPI000FEC061D|nr:metallophosphoesterase [Apibacter sp. HY039]